MSANAERPPSRRSEFGAAYPDGGVPRTPLEYRVGPHPKKDYLLWKTPPSRQLSREKRREYECDVNERFYDDYIGVRNTGDARNDVLVKTNRQGFSPDDYRLNAFQGLAYDPARTVPKTVDLNHLVRVETARERERIQTRARQRRLSAPAMSMPGYSSQLMPDYSSQLMPAVQLPPVYSLPPLSHSPARPQSAMQKDMDNALNPDVVPEVERWMQSASKKDREAAEKFLRTISSKGQRPEPLTKASKHATRVRSAVMTPSRAHRMEERDVRNEYQQLEREVAFLPPPSSQVPPPRKHGAEASKKRVRRSHSAVAPKEAGMFSSTKQRSGHFSIHPDWASEALNRY